MAHTVLITLHAAAGLVAFVAGVLSLRTGRYVAAFRAGMWAMALFLVGALAVQLASGELTGASAAIFGGLLVLAAVMVLRAEQARLVAPRPGASMGAIQTLSVRMAPMLTSDGAGTGRPSAAYVDRVGFGLIGLFDAFWVVTVMRLGAPGWAVAAVGVGIAVAGHLVLRRATAALDRTAEPVA